MICESILATDISELHDINRIVHLTGPKVWTKVIKDYLYSKGYNLNKTMPWPEGNVLTKHGDVLIHSIMGFNGWSPDSGGNFAKQMVLHLYTGHREGGWKMLTGIPRILYSFEKSASLSNISSWMTKNPTFKLQKLSSNVREKYGEFNNNDIIKAFDSFSKRDRLEFLKYLTLYSKGGMFVHPSIYCNTGFDQWLKDLSNEVTMSLQTVLFFSVS